MTTLLQTKIHQPRVRPGFISRARLAELLDGIDVAKVVLLSAPAGSGKSSLLSDWLNNKRRAAAWLSLDEGDNDVARFFAYLSAAIKTLQPEIGSGMEAMLQVAQTPAPQTILTYLANEISGIDDEIILILDDYHVITEAVIHDSLQFMIDYLPPQFHLVIATRIDPPLTLARLRTRGELLEIRANELRFDQSEAAHLLNQSAKVPLTASDVSTLEDKTEGWAAGLQLAALSLRGHGDAGAFIQNFKGSHRFILDFLVDEVLQQQPPALHDFLLHTAVLERLSVPLCNAVTQRVDSRKILDRLMEANLFVIALDDTQTWYRYHHLFRDALRHRLEQQSPESVTDLHRRAQRWYAEEEYIDEALHHALAADAVDSAAELIVRHARRLLNLGELHTLHSWLMQLPEAVLMAHPRLATTMAWIKSVRGETGEVERYIDAVVSAAEPSPELRGEIDALRALVSLNRRNVLEAIRLSEDSRRTVPDNDAYLQSLIHFNLGMAYRLSGDVTAAAQAYEDTVRLSATSGNKLASLYALTNLAGLREAGGELHLAHQTYQQMIVETTTAEGQPLPLAGLGYVGLGKILREWNRLDEAQAHLHEALRLGKQAGVDGIAVDGLITLALVRMGQRDRGTALDTLQQANQIVQRWQLPATLLRIQTFATRVQLLRGDPQVGERWRRESGVTVDDAPSEPQSIEQTMLARVLVAQGELAIVQPYIARLLAAAAREHRVTQLIELYTLQALAFARAGDTDAALAALDQALTFAEPGDYQRIFLDEGDDLLALLARFAKHTSPRATYASRLLGDTPSTTRQAPQSPALIEQLSERELEVLGLVAAGHTNQEIASKLFLAKSTVKKHLENIFGKLHVTNRTQAVIQAQELDLL